MKAYKFKCNCPENGLNSLIGGEIMLNEQKVRLTYIKLNRRICSQ